MRDCHRRAEVYLRTDTIGTYGAQQRVLDRIRRLDDQGVLDAAGVAARWDGIETYAGVDCFASEMRVDGTVLYEGCFSPDLGLAPYTAYYNEDRSLSMEMVLVSYEQH